ncbi:hypothetical protein CDL15_Pgr004159 [Punica granatum]|uniref:Uncharacterized protein n=1 Tax=Punica granatum TaxID=22663 RepID=A0A218XGB9_PUNGR|nr:hypothetical protein CDL15_Pgr004159 [Punica granatum]
MFCFINNYEYSVNIESLFIEFDFNGKALALALALANKGIFVTVVDFSEERGREVASLIEEENSKFHPNLGFLSALFVRCDISNSSHKAAERPGAIINLRSASGLYPMYKAPIKGVVMFTRSLLPYKRRGIRINVLCPEFVQTDIGLSIDSKIIDITQGFGPMEMVIKGLLNLSQMKVKRALVYGLQIEEAWNNGLVPGKKQNTRCFLQAVGIIAAVGDFVKDLRVGTSAALVNYRGYSEFVTAGQMGSGKVVLVTTAARGTGQFAVQVLKKEFPKGVDIVYESVGGQMLGLCLNSVAIQGSLIIISMISQMQLNISIQVSVGKVVVCIDPSQPSKLCFQWDSQCDWELMRGLSYRTVAH